VRAGYQLRELSFFSYELRASGEHAITYFKGKSPLPFSDPMPSVPFNGTGYKEVKFESEIGR